MNRARLIFGPLLSLIFLVIFASLSFVGYFFYKNNTAPLQEESILGSISGSAENILSNFEISQTPILEIDAESAISIESNLEDSNKIIFEKAGNIKLPIASLTKLMTAIVVLDNYNLQDNILVSGDANLQAPMKQDIKQGETLTVENLLRIMIVGSSNKSAYALAEGGRGKIGVKEFIDLMNKKAGSLGLKNTFFADPTGLSSENISTASDLAKLAEYILINYPEIAEISRIEELYVPEFGKISNTDLLLGEVPEIVCSKTGFTLAAKGCLLVVLNKPGSNNYLINVVLGADDRFAEMRKIISWFNKSCN